MRCAAFALALICVSAPAADASDVSIHDAWARATAGQSKIGAAYLKIKNGGTTTDRLIAATTPVAGTVELHATVQEGDVMRMQKLDSIEIAPGATVEFRPNGMHVMLIGVGAPLKQGARFPLTLVFASGVSVAADVAVLGPGASGPGPSHRH